MSRRSKSVLGVPEEAPVEKTQQKRKKATPAPRSGVAPASVQTSPPKRIVTPAASIDAGMHNMRTNNVLELEPSTIRPSPISDRLDLTEGLDSLETSIRASGQQQPVIVRPLEKDGFAYEVVNGRRRIEACKRLRIKVKAIVRNLSDEDAIIAQGIENNERQDTSFIERAIFAAAIREAGLGARVIREALGVDAPAISKMKTVTDTVSLPVLKAIGKAPKTGTLRWLDLAKRIKEGGHTERKILARIPAGKPSDERFAELLSALSGGPNVSRPSARFEEAVPEKVFVRHAGKDLGVKLANPADAEFLNYLRLRIPELFEQFQREGDT